MTRSRKLILAGVAVAAVIGGVATAAAHRGGWGHHGWGDQVWGHHGGGWGGWGGRHGGDFARLFAQSGGPLCSGRGAELADHMVVALEHRLKTTEAQKSALGELKAALRAGAGTVEAACPPRPQPAADGTRPPRPSPPERLERLEAGLVARLEAVRTIRPAAERFYASLSDEQKAKVAEMQGRRAGPHHRGWHGRWHERGDGPDRGREDGRESGPDRDPGRPEPRE